MNKEILCSGLRVWAMTVITLVAAIATFGAIMDCYQVKLYCFDILYIVFAPIAFSILWTWASYKEGDFEEK